MVEQRAMSASEVRDHWSEAVSGVATEHMRIRIERGGLPVAGLVSAQDLEWLALRDQRPAELRATVEQMRASFTDVPPEAIEREVARALDSVRAKAREEGAEGVGAPDTRASGTPVPDEL